MSHEYHRMLLFCKDVISVLECNFLFKMHFFFVPNDHRTDILTRYLNKDTRITLPDKKKLTEIKWFAVYDLTRQVHIHL